MGWNGSENRGAAPEPQKAATAAPSKWRGLIALLVIVAGGIAAWFALRPSAPETKHEARSAKRDIIAEVRPQIATNRVAEAEEPAKPKELPPQRVGETRDGKILLPSGRLHVVKGVVTNSSGLAKARYQIFDHPSENVIAGLLSIEPGQTLVGTPRYNGRLTEDFLESLKTPIVPSHEDSEHDRELKRAVNEAKIELKAAYDRGEDIEQILLDTRKELQALGRYKQELKAMALKGLDECSTEAEMEDTIAAANKMLEAKGIAPMNLSSIAKIKFRMKKEKEN